MVRGRDFFFRTLVEAWVAVEDEDEDDCLTTLVGNEEPEINSADERGAASVSSSGDGCDVDWRFRTLIVGAVSGLISVASGSGLRIFLFITGE